MIEMKEVSLMNAEIQNLFVDHIWECSQIDARETFEDGQAVSVGILKQIMNGLRFIPNSTANIGRMSRSFCQIRV
jgi:hypothetical protein